MILAAWFHLISPHPASASDVGDTFLVSQDAPKNPYAPVGWPGELGRSRFSLGIPLEFGLVFEGS